MFLRHIARTDPDLIMQYQSMTDLLTIIIIAGLKILPIAMSLDNYGYLIFDERAKTAILIDPADTEAVQV